MSSCSRYGYASKMSADDRPAATSPTSVATVTLMPRIHGLPPMICGSRVMRSSANMLCFNSKRSRSEASAPNTASLGSRFFPFGGRSTQMDFCAFSHRTDDKRFRGSQTSQFTDSILLLYVLATLDCGSGLSECARRSNCQAEYTKRPQRTQKPRVRSE